MQKVLTDAARITRLAIKDAVNSKSSGNTDRQIHIDTLLPEQESCSYAGLEPYGIEAVMLSFPSGLYIATPTDDYIVPVSISTVFDDYGNNPAVNLAKEIIKLKPITILSIMDAHGCSLPLEHESRDAEYRDLLENLSPVPEKSTAEKFKERFTKTREFVETVINEADGWYQLGQKGYKFCQRSFGTKPSTGKFIGRIGQAATNLGKTGCSMLNQGIRAAAKAGPVLMEKAPKAVKAGAEIYKKIGPKILDAKIAKSMGKVFGNSTVLNGAKKAFRVASGASTVLEAATLAWDIGSYFVKRFKKGGR